MKPPKKQEEKEKKGKGKPLEDELKDSLADDDSSSTTTETSNPDTEPLLKEVGRPRGAGWTQDDMLSIDTPRWSLSPAQAPQLPASVVLFPGDKSGSLLIRWDS